MIAGRRRIIHPQAPHFLSNAELSISTEKNIHTTNKNRLLRLYLYTFVYTHSYAYNKVKKRLSTWGESQEVKRRWLGGGGGRKKRKEYCNLISIKNL